MSNIANIAIVEDLPDVREGLAELFSESDDFTCTGAYASGEAARVGFAENTPDVVIMDIGLPGMNGIETMLRAKQQHPNLRFLVFTVFDNDEKVFEALKAGAEGYILKKEKPEKIVDAVRDLLDGGAPMSREIAYKVLSSFRDNNPAEKLRSVLTDREIEILERLSKGYLYKEIADQCGLTLGTVKQHLHRIYEKLHVQNRTEAINRYLGR